MKSYCVFIDNELMDEEVYESIEEARNSVNRALDEDASIADSDITICEIKVVERAEGFKGFNWVKCKE